MMKHSSRDTSRIVFALVIVAAACLGGCFGWPDLSPKHIPLGGDHDRVAFEKP